MVHVEETTSHRRFAGYFIRNAEHAQRAFNSIRSAPLPTQRRKEGEKKDDKAADGDKKAERKPAGAAWAPKSRQVRIAA
jgi:translation initiation factor 3 subunit L